MRTLLIYKILAELINTFIRIIRKVYLYIKKLVLVVKDHYYDKKLGIETSESYFSFPDQASSLYKDMHIHRPTSYDRVRRIIDYLKPGPEDVFIDFGCGKGRVVFLAAIQRLKKVIGVELDKKLVDIAKENLKNVRLNNTPVEIVTADAAVFDVTDGTILFLYDPFGPNTVKKVLDNIKNSLATNPRKIRIVYSDPVFQYLLDTEGWLVLEKRIENNEVSVWRNKK
ncbi:MAG: methyltransferase domain-containing protein [Candidatus Omnitrophica bacterium]|nr:methyltransferase domain-containing protein [Candidatus Omnitrophota bacterium]